MQRRPAAPAQRDHGVQDGLRGALHVLSRDLDRGCTVWPDVTGATYDRDADERDGEDVQREQNVRWQEDVVRYLTSGQAMIRHRAATGLSEASKRIVDAGPVLAASGRFVLHATDR